MAPRKRRDTVVRDLEHDFPLFTAQETYLRQHLGTEMGPLNVKQNEAILALIQVMKRVIDALSVINADLDSFENRLAIDEENLKKAPMYASTNEIVLKVGDAAIHMIKDGTIIIKGKDIRVSAAGQATIDASKDLILKGSKIREN